LSSISSAAAGERAWTATTGAACTGTLECGGLLAQAASIPTMSADATFQRSLFIMGLILLEALLAMLVLILIVWWTMFSGRKGGEPPPPDDQTNSHKN
jgi:hypothetical protein